DMISTDSVTALSILNNLHHHQEVILFTTAHTRVPDPARLSLRLMPLNEERWSFWLSTTRRVINGAAYKV
ncbi:hypothetical protein M8C21_009298, partial [Ambrosia artemisiifolia]